MATHLIVDGYNLIGIQKGLAGDIQLKREELIKKLRLYRSIKRHAVTIVFDGWKSGELSETREVIGGIKVIYSRIGEKADSVIIKLASKEKESCVVVSSDREVKEGAVSKGAVAITSGEFEKILNTACSNDNYMPYVDEEEEEPVGTIKKKGNPRRLSKTERKKRKKLGKL